MRLGRQDTREGEVSRSERVMRDRKKQEGNKRVYKG